MHRRTFLRGLVGGSALTLGLPLFDAMLNGNGTALAGGAPLPVRFGTWFWGCGHNPARWNPVQTGTDFAFPVELAALERHRERINILTGFDAKLGGKPNYPHHSGMSALRTGVVPDADLQVPGVSLDVIIANHIGGTTPFRSLDLSATANRADSYSFQGAGVVNPSEISPIDLYDRVFGAGVGTGGGEADPRLLLRKSVLSVVSDDVARLEGRLGSHDKQRLDQYLTSLRQLEQQIDAFLAGPSDLAACVTPARPSGEDPGTEIEQAVATHDLMAELLAMALACDRTRSFNMLFSHGLSELRLQGDNLSHHQLTHDELVDDALGYQPAVTGFIDRSMSALSSFLDVLAAVPEGEGTLLDNCVVLGHSETSFAKTHDISSIPVVIAGGGGGALATGQHISGSSSQVTRVGLTLQQLFGLPVTEWGTGPLATSQSIGELFA